MNILPPKKDPEKRVDNAVAYIRIIEPTLADAILSMTASLKRNVGKDLSLTLFESRIDKQKREAIRALLLCQRCFFSRPVYAFDSFSSLLKSSSISYWKSRGRSDIDEAIRIFTAPGDIAERLAKAAENANAAPNGGSINYKLTRNDAPFNIGSDTCYVAILAWLIKSGLVTYQWFLKHSNIKSVDGLRASLGTPSTLWAPTARFTNTSTLGNVPRGHIVHIYDSGSLTFGHWMVSLGNGLGCGCNNNAADGTNPSYSKTCSLDRQFLNGFNQGEDDKKRQVGAADVYDPTRIPNRHML